MHAGLNTKNKTRRKNQRNKENPIAKLTKKMPKPLRVSAFFLYVRVYNVSMRLLLLTGMSGAGKSIAAKILEDLGFTCVDNLPIPLIKNFIGLSDFGEEEKVAVGIDIRSGEHLWDLEEILEELRNDGKHIEILFLDAEDNVLLKRYKETRRNHPLSQNDRIHEGIKKERQAIGFLKDAADYIIDTSHLLTRELRAELVRIFMKDEDYKSMNVLILSFGYKYGIPQDADLVFDVRFLPNPYHLPELRPMTGNEAPMRELVMKYQEAHIFTGKLQELVEFLIPQYINEGKNQLVICVGCTGGKHRSVTLANELYRRMQEHTCGYGLKVVHRDIQK